MDKLNDLALVRYFSHDRCNVCKVLMPKIQQMLQEKFPRMQFEHIDMEKYPDMAAEYQVFTAPTILVFFEGKEYFRFARNVGLSQLEEAISRPYNLMFR